MKLALIAGAIVLVILVFASLTAPPTSQMEEAVAWVRGVLEGCGWEVPRP